MLTFATKHCNTFKINHHTCVGFLRKQNLIEIYFKSKKCLIEINNNKDTYEISNEEAFFETVQKLTKEQNKKQKTKKEKKTKEPTTTTKAKRGRPRKIVETPIIVVKKRRGRPRKTV